MADEVLVLASGSDRPGIMDQLSQFLLDNGGNIADSRSVNLRGQFSLLLLVKAEADAIERIRRGLAALAAMGIRVELHQPTGSGRRDESTFPYIFVASGKDRAGVLQRLSHLMRVLNVNIESMQTRVDEDQSFQIRLELSVPRETPTSMLKDYLTFLCKELGISGDLNQV
jgi:glycine cleavage system transcriptional repressor